MQLNLPKELEQFVESQLKTGNYTSAEQVVTHALRQMQQESISYAEWKADAGAKIQEGLDQLERGEFVTAEELRADIDMMFKKMAH